MYLVDIITFTIIPALSHQENGGFMIFDETINLGFFSASLFVVGEEYDPEVFLFPEGQDLWVGNFVPREKFSRSVDRLFFPISLIE
jgi:hypothetical protein